MTDTSTQQTDPPERRQDEPIDAQFEPAAEPVATPARGGGPGWIGLGIASVLAAIVGAAGGIYGAGQSGGAPAAGGADAQIAALTERQDALERQLAERPVPAQMPDDLARKVDTVSRRLDEALADTGDLAGLRELSARIEALEASGAGTPSADTESASALEARLASLEAAALEAARAEAAEPEPDPNAERMADAALAFSAIETAAARGAAFEAGYRTLREAVPEIESVRRLAPFVSGVQTLPALQNSFAAMRTEALEAHEAAGTPDPDSQLSWLNRVFGDAVTVRPSGEQADPVTDALDTAGRAVQSGDLAAAVAALGELDGASALAAQGWTREANRRITLEAVLDEVRLSLIEPEN